MTLFYYVYEFKGSLLIYRSKVLESSLAFDTIKVLENTLASDQKWNQTISEVLGFIADVKFKNKIGLPILL